MKAIAVKDGKPVKIWYHTIKVSNDTKYKYFVITEKIYHHELIQTIRYVDADKIVLEEDGKVIETYYAIK